MTTTGLVVICLTVVLISLLAFLGMMLRWAMTSHDRTSSTQEQTQKALSEAMERTVAQSVEIVRLQMELTELILVGRPNLETSQRVETEKLQEILPTQDELFRDLPANIKEAMIREAEEAGTWPSPWEKPPEESEDRTMEAMEELLRSASPTASKSTWVPQPEESNSG